MKLRFIRLFFFVTGLSLGLTTAARPTMAADAAASESAASQFLELVGQSADPASIATDSPIFETPLTRADSEKSAQVLWQNFAEKEKSKRAAELKSGRLKLGDREMPFTYKKFGTAPAAGHSLWISMHGGGGAPKAVNDRQWENQKRLYTLNEGIYVVPRAPTDTWDLWHQRHIDPLFSRLIEDMVIAEGVDPNRVYIMGYSAGGDGVYQLAPRMADQLAAAAMMAGHPNETKPLGLRNLPFALQMGGNDAAYNRNKIAGEWAEQLAGLQKNDPKGYVHFVKIYEGKGHWMDGEDKIAIPWMEKFTRNVHPDRVAWRQDDVTHDRFYWLAVDPAKARAGQELIVSRKGQEFQVERVDGVTEFNLVLDDSLADLDAPIVVKQNERVLFTGTLPRTLKNLVLSFKDRPDRFQMAPAQVTIKLNP